MIEGNFSTIAIHVKIKITSNEVRGEIIVAALVQEAVEVEVLEHIRILKRTKVEIEGLAVPKVVEGVRCLICRRHLLHRLRNRD